MLSSHCFLRSTSLYNDIIMIIMIITVMQGRRKLSDGGGGGGLSENVGHHD